jgi:signal transduction histidine kinase
VVSGTAYTLAAVAAEGSWLDDRGVPGLQTFAWGAAATAIGVAVRSSRATLAAAEARALQAEQTREEEAERRVSDERLRIARELHDVVAHHISVVNVQAGVARHLLDADPDQARAALDLVRDASKTVLSEMSTVVGLLRTAGEDAPTEPTPGLARVGELVDAVRQAGLDVTWTVSGDLDGLPPINDLTAYRVIQEALTNALKHGTGSATMVVTNRPEGVGIEVRNAVEHDGRQPSGSGHGLIGMRERIDAVRGRLVTGPGPDGAYRVSVLVPRGPA